MNRFLASGYLCLAIGGALLASGSALSALTADGQPTSVQATTTAFVVAAALRLLGAVGIVAGVGAIAARQSPATGWFASLAYLLVLLNMALQIGWMWADLFVSGVLADRAPGILDGTDDAGRLGAAFLAAWILNASLALLGIVTLRAHVFSRWVGWGLVVAGGITVIPLPVDGPVYEVIIGAALLVAGLAAQRSAPLPESQSEVADSVLA